MLIELNIKNFALIDNLAIQFEEGLNIFTGETGAGKSIIVDAIELLLGGRANSSSVRKGSQRSEISAQFEPDPKSPAHKRLKDLGLDVDGCLVILRREIDISGKSRAYINDRPVSASTQSELGELLVDIHGQGEHQRLLKSIEQRDLLDLYGGNGTLREETASAYQNWKKLRGELDASRISDSEKEQRIDLYKFQLREMENARLKPGEEEELESLLPRLKNSDRLKSLAGEIYSLIYDDEGAANDRLRKCQKAMESASSLGLNLKESMGLLEQAIVNVDEIADSISCLRENLESEPGKLDETIGRLDLISKLKRKYGKTVPEILEYQERIRDELNRLENQSESLKNLEDKIKKAHASLFEVSRELSKSRKKASEKLSKAMKKELGDLGFNKALFSVNLVPEIDGEGNEFPASSGLEKVEFLFSANPGEDPKPLKDAASGGELSRVMLALKKILAEMDFVPTLIFDEVDSGIGGSMGHVVGEKLRALGASHQVLVITHLPQIAAQASRHFSVSKKASGDRTVTTADVLEKDSRVKEIARMLGGSIENGEEPTPASLKHASELIHKPR